MTLVGVAASYREAHRYDGAAVEQGRRTGVEPCAVQPRDVAIVHDVHRYKFLTASQVRELHWGEASVQAADRRLLRLFRAGLIDRFRPYARRGLGSFPWTYQLGEHGHRLLRDAGVIVDSQRFRRRAIFDYGHVLHEVQLNAWVLAYRRALGDAFLAWDGETTVAPPTRTALTTNPGGDWTVEGAPSGRLRSIRPDAVIEIAGDSAASDTRLVLVEFDRTRRLDKNFDKLLRYDVFLTWWWRASPLGSRATPPFVLFICQDDEQRDLFVHAADRDLRCHWWHPDALPDAHDFVGRQRILFAAERDIHDGSAVAHRVPRFPPGHPGRQSGSRRVLVGPSPSDPAPRPDLVG